MGYAEAKGGDIMTSDEPALLAAILAAPEEDTPRLVYADWLDENAGTVRKCMGQHQHAGKVGQELHGIVHTTDPRQLHHHCDEKCEVSDGRRERAEFIRGQIKFSLLDDAVKLAARGCLEHNILGEPGTPAAWLRRERELLETLFTASATNMKTRNRMEWFTGLWMKLRLDSFWSFSRGFVSELTCDASDWLCYADRLTAIHPIEVVKVRNISPWADVTAWGMPRGKEGKYWKTSRWLRIKFETLSTASGLRD